MTETVELFHSIELGNERPIWVLTPAEPNAASHLIVFLDGELYRDRIGALATIGELVGTRGEAWFVFVSMHNPESRWTELPFNPRYAAFIVDEVLPWLVARFPPMTSVSERTLIGVSYSGLAAAYIAKQYPGVFQKVIAQSGSFWSEDGRLSDEYRARAKPVPTEFYLEVGTRETQENVRHRPDILQKMSQIEGVRRFRDALKAGGHVVRYVEFDGAHEAGAWQKALPAALAWALGK